MYVLFHLSDIIGAHRYLKKLNIQNMIFMLF